MLGPQRERKLGICCLVNRPVPMEVMGLGRLDLCGLDLMRVLVLL